MNSGELSAPLASPELADTDDIGEEESRTRFTKLRQCRDQLSEKVSGLDISTGPMASGCMGRGLGQSVRELEGEVRKQGDAQLELVQGQLEMRVQLQDISDQVYSRTSSCGASMYSNIQSPSSNLSEFSSIGSFFPATTTVERQRDELELCLSREMLKNVERGVMELRIGDEKISRELAELRESVQRLWQSRTNVLIVTAKKLPPHVRAICLRIEDVVHIRVNDLARHLNLDDNFQVKGSNYRSMFWSLIDRWNQACHSNGSGPFLETLLDACIKCGMRNPLDVEPMSLVDRRVLEQNYSYLACNVMVPVVLTYLRDYGMLTSDLVRYVLEPDARPDKVTRLVDIITVFGKHGLQLLKDSLRRSGQSHIADRLICHEEAIDPEIPISVHPSSSARLKENLKCELREIHIDTDQIRKQQEVCQLPTGKIWSGLLLNMDVSVKIPHHSISSLRVLMEATQQRELKHKHVLGLIGVSLYIDPPWIITESVQDNLLNHLRSLQAESVSGSTLLNMATQICSGMSHIEQMDRFHGDLRAGNILMTSNRTLKLANFHVRDPHELSEPMANCSRWSAPETVLNNITSIKSDVWAFGIVLWEIVTLGLVPYPEMDPSEMTERVTDGYVMSRPKTAFSGLDNFYDVMVSCWNYSASERPTFHHLSRSALSSPELRRSRRRSHVNSYPFMDQRTTSPSSVSSPRDSLRRRRSIARDRRRYTYDVTQEEDPSLMNERKKEKKKKRLNFFRKLFKKKK